MTPNWKDLFCVLLLALMGGPGLEAEDQISRTADAWKVSFTGPDTIFTGIESKFTCVTSCIVNVECAIGWKLSSGFPSGSFSTNNSVVTWTPSKPGYQSFTCVARNATTGQSAEATKTVEVKVNAWKVTVTGPDTIFTGIESKFTCVPSCTVNMECTIGWKLSSGSPSGSFSTNKGVVTWTPSKPGSQSFTCVARNATTGQSAEATKTVEVNDAPVTPAVAPTVPDPGSGAAQLVVNDTVTDTLTITPSVPDPGSGAAHLTGPFTLMLSLGLLMVLEI